MPDTARQAAWLSQISRRVREREIRRQILYSRLGNQVARRLPTLLPEFLKMLLGSLIGFWIITALLAYIPHARPLYTLPLFGLLFSLQATYYKYRLARDPGYKIPKCRCPGRENDNTEAVLRSRESSILRLPNSVLGVVVYVALLILVHWKHTDAAMWLAVAALLASAYLSYVMVVRIRSLCANCVNVAALNVLMLWHLVR
jgi:uncharacterized membrane protein